MVLQTHSKNVLSCAVNGASACESISSSPSTVPWRMIEPVRQQLDWRGNVGVITTLFPKVTINPRNTVAATCGPPIMYRFVLMEMLGKGIPETQIYLSLERRMKCGVGKCGHCQINDLYCCQDGPVFTYAQIKGVEEAL